jgi:hypothetical protein
MVLFQKVFAINESPNELRRVSQGLIIEAEIKQTLCK